MLHLFVLVYLNGGDEFSTRHITVGARSIDDAKSLVEEKISNLMGAELYQAWKLDVSLLRSPCFADSMPNSRGVLFDTQTPSNDISDRFKARKVHCWL